MAIIIILLWNNTR